MIGVTDWFAGSKVAFTLLRWCDRLYWMCLACSLCYWQRRWWRRRWWCLVYSHTTIGIRLIKLVTIHTCIRDSCFCSFVSFISFTGQTVAGSRSYWLFPCICRDDEIGLDFPLIQTIRRERWTELMNRTTRHSQCSFCARSDLIRFLTSLMTVTVLILMNEFDNSSPFFWTMENDPDGRSREWVTAMVNVEWMMITMRTCCPVLFCLHRLLFFELNSKQQRLHARTLGVPFTHTAQFCTSYLPLGVRWFRPDLTWPCFPRWRPQVSRPCLSTSVSILLFVHVLHSSFRWSLFLSQVGVHDTLSLWVSLRPCPVLTWLSLHDDVQQVFRRAYDMMYRYCPALQAVWRSTLPPHS
jgi:hypothetical protein